MATALDLLTRSLRLLGVVAAGEAPRAEDAQDALTVLNDLLDAWQLEALLVYAIDRQVFPITASVSSYTIGAGGVFNTARPVRIERASFLDITAVPQLELPLTVLSDQQYQDIGLKGVQGTWPAWLYYDRAYPLGHVLVWPVPTLNNQLALYLWHPLTQIPLTTTVVDLPPGYRRCLQYNLAVELAPEFGVSLAPEVKELAAESKDRLKSVNHHAPLMSMDLALTGGVYNIYSDSA